MTALSYCHIKVYSKSMTKPKLRIINGQRDALERSLEEKLVKALFSPDATEITYVTAQLEALAKKQPSLSLVAASDTPQASQASTTPPNSPQAV